MKKTGKQFRTEDDFLVKDGHPIWYMHSDGSYHGAIFEYGQHDEKYRVFKLKRSAKAAAVVIENREKKDLVKVSFSNKGILKKSKKKAIEMYRNNLLLILRTIALGETKVIEMPDGNLIAYPPLTHDHIPGARIVDAKSRLQFELYGEYPLKKGGGLLNDNQHDWNSMVSKAFNFDNENE